MIHLHDVQRAVETAENNAVERVAAAIEKISSELTDDQGRSTELAQVLERLVYALRYGDT